MKNNSEGNKLHITQSAWNVRTKWSPTPIWKGEVDSVLPIDEVNPNHSQREIHINTLAIHFKSNTEHVIENKIQDWYACLADISRPCYNESLQGNLNKVALFPHFRG